MSQELSALIQSVTTGPILFLLLANLVVLVLGAVPAMIMLVPVLLPMAMQFKGLGLIVAAAIGRVSVTEVVPVLLSYRRP